MDRMDRERRNPFEQLFDRLNRGIQGPSSTRPRGGHARGQTMNVDVADHGEEYVITADIPGVAEEDIEVRLADGSVHISATRSVEHEESDQRYLRRERRYESFGRSIDLPGPVEDEAATATYTNGVLTVSLPKVETAGEERYIEIE